MTFRDQLVKLYACSESLEWVGNKTIEQAWKTCKNPQWMIWILEQTELDLIDPICDIAESVLYLIPGEHKQACSNAISAARRRAPKEELYAAYDAAYDAANISASAYNRASAAAARTAASIAYYVADAAYFTDDARIEDVSYSATVARIEAVADSVAAYFYDVASAAYKKEQKKQCDIIRGYFTINQVKEAFNKLVA
jgi:hypothetical protein